VSVDAKGVVVVSAFVAVFSGNIQGVCDFDHYTAKRHVDGVYPAESSHLYFEEQTVVVGSRQLCLEIHSSGVCYGMHR